MPTQVFAPLLALADEVKALEKASAEKVAAHRKMTEERASGHRGGQVGPGEDPAGPRIPTVARRRSPSRPAASWPTPASREPPGGKWPRSRRHRRRGVLERIDTNRREVEGAGATLASAEKQTNSRRPSWQPGG